MLRAIPTARLCCAGLLVLCVAVLGCGSGKPASVNGKVVYQGKTLTTGTLTLIGPDNVAASCVIGQDGSFSIDHVTSGKVLVGVSSPNPTQSAGRPDKGGRTGRDPVKPAPAPKSTAKTDWFPIPDKFANPDTSGVSIEVKPGAQTLTIDLVE